MLESAHEGNPWSKPTSTATNQETNGQSPFVKQYTFHIDPTTDEHVLMTTTTKQKELRTPVTKLSMEDKSQESNTASTNKTTGSRRAASPGSSKPAAARQLEDIWKKDSASGSPERRRNGFGSDDDVDDGGLGNGESRAGFISRRPSMTAELETRIRQVRLSEGSDPDRNSGPSSPSATSKWGVYGMNWNTQNPLLGERTTPPQEQNQPISPLARFHQSPLDPPAPRQVSPGAPSQGYTASRPRYNPPPPVDQNQRVQRSQSFSVGDHGGFTNYLPGQTGPIPSRNTLFEEPGLSPVGARFKPTGHAGYPASPLARAPIAEEIDEFDASLDANSKENSPSRYQDRGRSLSTSAASHGYTRQRMGEAEDIIDEALYEEDEDAALQEFEPLSRSRTLPTEHGQMAGLGFSAPRYAGLTTERERLQQQRGPRQSPRIVEDIPTSRRQDSYPQAAWDETRAHRSPPRSTEYPGMQDTYDPLEAGSMASPGSMHSYPGIRDYTENYFTNDDARRRVASEQFQYYQMQSRTRHPQFQASQGEIPRPFPYHDPDQYTLHFVKFKANRMDVFYLAKEKKLDLKVKDYVIVDGDRGTDLGMVSKVNVTEAEARSLTAQLQREQAAATAANQNGMNANAMEAIAAAANQVQERDVTIPKKYIHRLAVKNEIDGLQNKMQDEAQAKQVCEMKVQQRGLHMDILDVEYQWYLILSTLYGTNFRDRRKLYIYFIAPQRVDFVALVKDLFKIYKTRIWLHNSTASHVTSQLASPQSSFHASSQPSAPESHEYSYPPPHLQPQYDYYRPQRQSPGQQNYYPMQPQQMYSANLGLGGAGYYSPHQQTYFPPSSRAYPPPQQPPPTQPPHMPFQSSGQPPPSGQW